MLIRTAVRILMWVLGLVSIPMLIFAIINKKASVAKGLIFLGIYLPIFVLAMIWLTDIINVEVSFDIVIYYMAVPVFLGLDVISMIINAVKMKKLDKTAKNKPFFIGVLVITTAPIVLLSAVCLRQVIILRTSPLVVKVYSYGSAVGDGDRQVYAYDGKDIKRVDLGSSYGLDQYLPADMNKSADNASAGDYSVQLNGADLTITDKKEGNVTRYINYGRYSQIKAVYYR